MYKLLLDMGLEVRMLLQLLARFGDVYLLFENSVSNSEKHNAY
jgi:hypothetical protein